MLEKWNAKVAGLASGENVKLNIVCLGDSGIAGTGASGESTMWTRLIYDHFAQKYEACDWTMGVTNPLPAFMPPPDPRYMTRSGNWDRETAIYAGFGGYPISSETSGDSVTYTVAGTGVRVYFLATPIGAEFTVIIDGVSYSATAQMPGVVEVRYWEKTGLSDGDHQVQVVSNSTGASNFFILSGIGGTHGTRGVSVHNASVSGSKASQILAVSSATQTMVSLPGSINPFAPDLIIACYGGNEILQGDTPNALGESVDQLLTQLAELAPNADVILMSFGVIGQADIAAGYTQADYMAAMQAQADAHGIYFWNVPEIWSQNYTLTPAEISSTTGWLADDQTHANDAGHAELANYMLSLIDVPAETVEYPLRHVVLGNAALPTTGEPITVYYKTLGTDIGVYITDVDGAIVKLS